MHPMVVTLLGGVLIGLSAAWLLMSHGRIAGISGILGGLLEEGNASSSWRLLFLIGLLGGGALLATQAPEYIVAPEGRSSAAIVIAGLLVGYGTRMGSGCTSGHGVCGLARFSKRSLVATMTFMATGFATATAISLLGGVI